ncbi:two-component system cell cycle sensor histidine kinase/response regulator CckA [Rhodoligotrophos appendicifer]|uniref:cell cycle histidine kinase CckA n=1 Tax=Rhodoligotrophos appendicifer TaxID=987056 RepID=UPI0011854744|nr:response regulator [Rhodoligotrophos appendicifer]
MVPVILTIVSGVSATSENMLGYWDNNAVPVWVQAGIAMAGVFGLIALIAWLSGFAHFGGTSKTSRFFEALFDTLPDACAVTDARGRVVYSNTAYKSLLAAAGLNRPIGVEGLYSGYPDISDRIYRLSLASREGHSAHEEFRLAAASVAAGAKKDRPAWIRITVERSTATKTWYTLWRVTDVTDDRARQEAAFEHLQYIIDYLDHAPAGFFSADHSGRIDYINATLAGWLGIDLAKTTDGNLNLRDFIAESGLPLLSRISVKAGAKTVESFDLDLITADRRLVPVQIIHRVDFDDEGRQKPSRSLVLDKRSGGEGGRMVESAQIRLSRLVNGAPIGIAQVDDLGIVRNANAAFTSLSAKAGTRGARLLDMVEAEHREAVEAALIAARDGRPPAAPVDVVLAEGNTRTAQMFISRIEDSAGEEPSVIVYAVDTTEHRALELQFAQSQKMQAIGQLAGGIAHDFNNVLTAIIGFSDLLLARHRPTDPSFKDIMNIKQNANRAANLVRQLLAFSRRQTLRPEVLSLTDALSDLGNLLGRLLGEKIELRMVHGRDLGLVKVDVNQFEQVIMNLAVNARDAMPNGGSLSIRTTNEIVIDGSGGQHDMMPPGDYVLCEVTDTGTGMSKDVVEKIYEPFFSTKEVGKGTGLGLSTVYGIIKQTGGFIFCESQLGTGTTFRIYLPRHAAEAVEDVVPPKTEKKEAKRKDLTGNGTILLVEDEEAVRAFASRALAQRGYTIVEADSGASALALVEEQQGKIDLVLSDVVMPEMDGPTLLKELRKRGIDSKVIFISGYAEDAFRKNLEDMDDFAFLPKPFTLKQLAAAVKEAIES